MERLEPALTAPEVEFTSGVWTGPFRSRRPVDHRPARRQAGRPGSEPRGGTQVGRHGVPE